MTDSRRPATRKKRRVRRECDVCWLYPTHLQIANKECKKRHPEYVVPMREVSP